MVQRQKTIEKPSSLMKKHWKTIDTNGGDVENHQQRWFTRKKTIEKPLTTMVP